jgi:putative hydrolase of the HAD superfamily
MMMKQYTHLFFDLDRTLWDFQSNSTVTLKEMYDCFSLKVYYAGFYDFYRTFHEINDRLWEDYRQKLISKSELRYERFYQTLLSQGEQNRNLAMELDEYYVRVSPTKTLLFDGVKETISALSLRFPLYILTNGFKEVQYEKLKNCGLSPYFKKVYISELIGHQKPSPGFFTYVMQDIGVGASECLMIGDDENTDIIGAAGVGIDQVLFNPENRKIHSNPTYIIKKLNELVDLI